MQCTQEKQEKRAPGRKGGLGAEQQRLLEEYRDVLAQQKQVRAAFEQVTDP